MKISEQFDTIVQTIVEDIQTRVNDQVNNLVRTELKRQLEDFDYTTLITQLASEKLKTKIDAINLDESAVQDQVNKATNLIVGEIEKQAQIQINTSITQKVAGVNFNKQLEESLTRVVASQVTNLNFPPKSISAESIKQANLQLSGDQINGGIIKNFASTGIQDNATQCSVTIMDAAVVVENNLVTLDLTVHGNLDVKGTVLETSPFYKQLTSAVTSSVQAGLDTELFTGFSDTIFNKIKTDGLDLNRITVNQQPVIDGKRIGYGITESNLQKLGLLKELQVSGESQFAETLYVTNKRTGINTVEPSAALAVWDEDIEITVSKDKSNTGRIGTPRNQSLVLGSNRNNNIVLNVDGSVTIDHLQIGQMKFTTDEKPPRFASTKGHVVFNSNPSVGGPLGWVCLGAANWANFGIID